VAKIKKINHGNYLYKKSFFSKIEAQLFCEDFLCCNPRKGKKDYSGGSGLEKEDISLCRFDFR